MSKSIREVAEELTGYNKISSMDIQLSCNGIETVLGDINNIHALIHEIIDDIKTDDAFKLLANGDQKRAEYIFYREKQIYSLLKSLYVFSDVFINLVIVLKTNKEKLEDLLLDSNSPSWVNCTLPIHCIKIYRNRFLIHLNELRSAATSRNMNQLYSHRLVPINLDWDSASTNGLLELKRKYSSDIPELVNEGSKFELLRIMFYKIPVRIGNQYNKADRDKVNKLAEKFGVKSQTCCEIQETIDDFIEIILNYYK